MFADSRNLVSESNETNNNKTEPLSVEQADLIVASITWTPTDISDGEIVTFNATIKNNGTGSLRTFYNRFYIDGTSIGGQYVYGLSAGSSINISQTWTATPGGHVIKVFADSNKHVDELNETNNNRSEPLYIEHAGLIVEDITWTQTNISDGEIVTFSAAIKNNGTGTTLRTFHNKFYIDGSSIGSKQIKGLSAGSSINITHTWTATPGSHNITVFADSNNAVSESNEINNNRTELLSVEQADLAITNISWSPVNISDGDTVTVTARVENIGTGNTSRDFYVRFEVNSSYNYVGRQKVSGGLAAGGSVDVSETWIAKVGEHTVKVIADEYDTVDESDEGNNELLQALSQIPYPDLTITNLTWSPTNFCEGTTVQLIATIRNAGEATLRNFYVSFEVDGSFIGRRKVKGLAAGESVEVEGAWTAEVGTHTVNVIADEYDVVAESEEGNNNLSMYLPEVVFPDLTITNLSWSPHENIGDGEEVTFTATVKNNGSGSTHKDFFVRFEVDGNYIGRQKISGLGAGNYSAVNQAWTAQAGTHTVKAIVNEYNAVTESNETNNNLSKTLPAVLASDLTITNLTWSPGDIKDGEEITFRATVENKGADDTFESFYVRFEVDDSYVGRQQISGSMTAGESRVVNQTWTAKSGSFMAKAIADEYNDVTESNETNNEQSAILAISAPDLTVTNITFQASNISISDGEEVNITARVENIGSGDTARDFWVRFEVDNETIDWQKVSGGLAAGKGVEISQKWIAEVGTHTAKVLVDDYDKVTESDEGNNELTMPLPETLAPDLTITNITWSPHEGFSDGEAVNITTIVKNIGANTSRDFWVRFEVDDKYMARREVSGGLAAGEEKEVNATWVAESGTHTVKIIADEYNDINESTENNNESSKPLSEVIAPDLVITEIICSPASSISDGDSVNITATVQNIGGDTKWNFFVGIAVDDVLIGSSLVTGGLVAGDSKQVNRTWIAHSGAHTVNVSADKFDAIAESNESNNELNQTLPVVEDNNPPTLDRITPSNRTLTGESSFDIIAVLSDGFGSGVDLESSTLVVRRNGKVVTGVTTTSGDNQIVFTPDGPFTDGNYTVTTTAIDNTGNAGSPNITSFTVDLTAPEIEVGGVTEGGYYENPVTPIINATDLHLESVTISLNVCSFASGTTISVDGVYFLKVKAVDEVGNTANESVNFTMDTPPRAPTGLGLVRGLNISYLSWNANVESDIAGYNVYRDGAKINEVLITDTTYQDTNITAGVEYVYQVSAVDAAGHESERADVASVYITLVSYGTSVDGVPYLTRGFVDNVKAAITNKGSSRINVSSVEFELIDSVGNVCYKTTYGSFNIEAGGSEELEKRILVDENLTSKLRIVVNLVDGGQISTSFVVNVRSAPDSPLEVSAPALMEGYGDEIEINFTNYGSASLSINIDEIEVYLKDSGGNITSEGGVSGPWMWVGPNTTLTWNGFISTPLPAPDNLSLTVKIPSYYGYYHGQHRSTNFSDSINASVKCLTVPPLELYSEALTKGSTTQFTLILTNQGTASLFIEPGGVKIRLKGIDGDVLSEGTASGSLKIVSPGCSAEFLISGVYVPLNAEDIILMETEVTKILLIGNVKGPEFNMSTVGSTVEPPYNANASTDKSIYNRGEEVTITGEVRDTDGGELVPDAELRLEICSKGFNRVFEIKSDSAGKYNFTFKPLALEAGKYIVGATHPMVEALESDTSLEILGLCIIPHRLNLEMSQNSVRTVNMKVKNIGETRLTNINLGVIDEDGTDEVEATIVGNEVFNLEPGESRAFNVNVSAGLNTPEATSFVVKAISNQSKENATLNVNLHTAAPAAKIEPSYLETGLNPGSVQVDTLTITNYGYGEMSEVVVAEPSLPWISIISETNLSDIPAGENRTFDMLIHPAEDIEAGIYEDSIKIRSSNHRTVTFPMRITITPEKTGNLLFIVNDEFGEPISKAHVSIVHQEVFTLAFSGEADSEGRLCFNVPIGRYRYKVEKEPYERATGNALVEVGAEKKVELSLSYQFLKIEWRVLPIKIRDEYVVVHKIIYETKAPVPYIEVKPSNIQLALAPGESTRGQLELTNKNELLSVFDVKPKIDGFPDYVSIEFAVSSIPEIKPMETVTVPYVVKLKESFMPFEPGNSSSSGNKTHTLSSCGQVSPLPEGDTWNPCEGISGGTSWNAADVCVCWEGGTCVEWKHVPAGSTKWTLLNKPDVCSCLGAVGGCFGLSASQVWYCCDMFRQNTDLLEGEREDLRTIFGCMNVVGARIADCDQCFADGNFPRCLDCFNVPVTCAVGVTWHCGWWIACQVLPDLGITIPPGEAPPRGPVYGEDWEISLGWIPPYWGGGGGLSGGGGGESPWFSQKCSPEMCVRIKLEIEQEVTLERQAFDARLGLTNTLSTEDLTDIKVDIEIRDSAGNLSNDKFFINITGMENIEDIEGDGVLHPGKKAEISWIFIPTPGAGGTKPEGVKYTAKANISGKYKGNPILWETLEDEITVEPMPMLILDYVIPREVYGDDPMTVGIKEPVIPFVWGVRVKNDGYGPACNLEIDSAQPKIVGGTPGAWIDFKLTGTWVDGELKENTLKLNFGDIEPGDYAVGGWEMRVSHKGNFTNYTAEFTHSDSLGGEATSLIQDVRTHILVKDFINDLPGEDEMFDFLVDTNGDGMPDMIIDSRYADQAINHASAEIEGEPTPKEPTVNITLDKGAGDKWVYAGVADPLGNENNISKIVRCIDGKELDSRNYWLRDGKIHFVDNATEEYIVTYDFGDTAAPSVINPSSSQIIPDDTDNNPLWGETATLNVTVTDESSIASVTINLSAIGGSPTRQMTNMSDNIWSVTVNASAGTPPGTYYLLVNATDIHGNSDTTVSIPLTVMRNGDTTGNDVVDIGDAMLLANHVSYPYHVPPYTISNPFVADVSGNGVLNIADAMLMANNVSYPYHEPAYVLR